jgi:hypothetical protein
MTTQRCAAAARGVDRSYVCGTTDRPLRHRTVDAVLRDAAAAFPARAALAVPGQGLRHTFATLDREVSRIGIWSPNRAEWLLTMFGAALTHFNLVNNGFFVVHGRIAVPDRADAARGRRPAHARGDHLLRDDGDQPGELSNAAGRSAGAPRWNRRAGASARPGEDRRSRGARHAAWHAGELLTRGYSVMRGGENISPLEIEEFLFRHPAVLDVAVVGVPDVKYGGAVCAGIRLRAGMSATEEEIRSFCGQIEHYKVPRHVRILDSFPLTVSGKVQKYLLREQPRVELGLGDEAHA